LPELFTEFVETGTITTGITKIEKLVIALMRASDLDRVLDRAPVLLSAKSATSTRAIMSD